MRFRFFEVPRKNGFKPSWTRLIPGMFLNKQFQVVPDPSLVMHWAIYSSKCLVIFYFYGFHVWPAFKWDGFIVHCFLQTKIGFFLVFFILKAKINDVIWVLNILSLDIGFLEKISLHGKIRSFLHKKNFFYQKVNKWLVYPHIKHIMISVHLLSFLLL